MDANDITKGSRWARGGNRSNPVFVMGVLEGYVMYRVLRHLPGVLFWKDFLREFEPLPVSREESPRVRRTR